MPSRPKAQARGEVISRTGGRASSKCDAAQDGRSGRRDRPTQAPRAQRARPWQSSEPTSSSQRRSKPRKLRNRLRLAVEGRLEERRVGRGEPLDLRPVLAQLLQEHRQQQGPGVVVGAVALGEVGDGVGGVLEHPRRVGHPRQVVEPPVGQLGLLLGERAHRQRLERLVLAAEAGPLERLHVVVGGRAPRSSRGPAGTPACTSRAAAARRASSPQISRARRRRVGERHEHPAAVGQQLLGVPVRRRDDRLAAAERVGQRARGDLRRVQVRASRRRRPPG